MTIVTARESVTGTPDGNWKLFKTSAVLWTQVWGSPSSLPHLKWLPVWARVCTWMLSQITVRPLGAAHGSGHPDHVMGTPVLGVPCVLLGPTPLTRSTVASPREAGSGGRGWGRARLWSCLYYKIFRKQKLTPVQRE